MGRRKLATLGVVLLVIVAGCAGGGGGGDAAEPNQAASQSGDGAPSEAEPTGSETGLETVGNVENVQATRHRIKRATYHVTVENFDDARTDLQAAVRSAGGYVGSESFETHSRHNVTWQTGTIVLRVPKERYGELASAVEAVGDVDEKSSETVDVTGEVVDLQARLDNLRAQRERLRAMFDRSESTEDALRIQERLSSVQSDIERLEGQLRTLENKIAYSTITVELSEKHPEAEPAETAAWYEQSLVVAFLDSVDGAVVVARMISVFVVGAIPYLVLFGALGGVSLLLVRAIPIGRDLDVRNRLKRDPRSDSGSPEKRDERDDEE